MLLLTAASSGTCIKWSGAAEFQRENTLWLLRRQKYSRGDVITSTTIRNWCLLKRISKGVAEEQTLMRKSDTELAVRSQHVCWRIQIYGNLHHMAYSMYTAWFQRTSHELAQQTTSVFLPKAGKKNVFLLITNYCNLRTNSSLNAILYRWLIG